MRRKTRYLLLVPLCVSLCQGTLSSPAAPQETAAGKIIEETVHSVALEANLLGDSPDRRVTIYLPAGYENSTSRYPVVYLLHGYPDTDQVWTSGVDYKPAIPAIMNRAIAASKIRRMIIVMPNSLNKFGGSFYTNSVTTGNWDSCDSSSSDQQCNLASGPVDRLSLSGLLWEAPAVEHSSAASKLINLPASSVVLRPPSLMVDEPSRVEI